MCILLNLHKWYHLINVGFESRKVCHTNSLKRNCAESMKKCVDRAIAMFLDDVNQDGIRVAVKQEDLPLSISFKLRLGDWLLYFILLWTHYDVQVFFVHQ